MKYCSKCGNEIMDEAVVCPKCGCAVEKEIVDESNTSELVASVIGSILIPILGLILFFVYLKKKPKVAKASGIAALVSWIIYVLLLL